VEFEHCGHQLCVTVTDQGKGFNHMEARNDPKIAHGLSIARQRLSLFGCRLEVNSQIGKGTKVIIEVPFGKMDT
jgi:signal transduction histidine kinase